MSDTEKLLEERAKTHGEYANHAECTQALKKLMASYFNWPKLSDCQKETLEMIAHKIGRILTGNPDINDHWDDIAGYAKLVSQRIPGAAASRKPPVQQYTDRVATVPLLYTGYQKDPLIKLDHEMRHGTPEDGGHHARD